MNFQDAFAELAPYYDQIMDHVNYDRWYAVVSMLSTLFPRGFHHVDAACGTGTLLKRLRADRWNSVGADFSYAMIRSGHRSGTLFPGVVSDLRALPFSGGVDYITCLFDSINFLLSIDDVTRAFSEIRQALAPQGLFYFDIVTERMVTQHFEGKDWTEDNGRFSSTWSSRYSRRSGIAETSVRVNSGPQGTVRERIYLQREIEKALEDAGLTLLGAFDAHTWKPPHRRTVRIDFAAAKDPSRALRKQFDSIYAEVRRQFA